MVVRRLINAFVLGLLLCTLPAVASSVEVVNVSPPAGSHVAAVDTSLGISFSGGIAEPTATPIHIVTYRSMHGRVGGNVSIGATVLDPITLTFPFFDFHPGELVQTIVTSGVLAPDLTPLAPPYVWQFRAAVDAEIANFVDSGNRLGSSISNGVALGDIDHDGDLDAFVVNSAPYFGVTNKVWLNNGAGVFTDSVNSLENSDSRGVSLGDLDGDGDLDAFVANINGFYEDGANKVWLNNGNSTGVFIDSGNSLGNSESYDVSLGDVDGDGDLDAFVANYGAPNKLWLNDGGGLFTDSGNNFGVSDSLGVELGDFDGDGDLDAFVANSGAPNEVWLNSGAGIFTDSGNSLGSSASRGVSLGDVDGDGDLDAFVGNFQADKVWLNDGAGIFTDSGNNLGSSSSRAVSLADVDGDGDLDAFVVGVNRIWRNDGAGVFTDSGNRLGDLGGVTDASLGDVDGDGDLDAFIAVFGNPNEVWLTAPANGAYTIGGTIYGLLPGSSVVLQNNGGDNLTVGATSVFTFATPLSYASTYAVTALTQPSTPNQFCAITDANGTVAGADITHLYISCVLDSDSDGIGDLVDNCTLLANPTQVNSDGDELGDACDSDDDNDGLLDTEEDSNGNGMVDPGETDPFDSDTDGDGYADGMEVTHGSDPLDITSVPAHGDPTLESCLTDGPEAFSSLSGGVPITNLQLPRNAENLAEFLELASYEDWLVASHNYVLNGFPDSDSLVVSKRHSAGGVVAGLSPIVNSAYGVLAYLTTENSVVEAWDVEDSNFFAGPVWARNVVRAGCPFDRMLAAPVLQQRRYSSAGFKATYSQNLIYASTDLFQNCGGNADGDNRVIALNADTGAIEWTFNFSGQYDVDGILATPVLDYSTDLLFFTTERSSANQDSLWAIDVLTGTRVWSANLGAIWASPIVTEDKVYVVNLAGTVVAVDKMTGTGLWSISNGIPLITNAELIQHPSGETYIASVDLDGNIWLVRDEQLYASQVWSITLPGGVLPTTSPVAGLGGENLFVGADDGRVYQLDLLTGTAEASRQMTANGAVSQLALQQDNPFNDRAPSLFASSDDGIIHRYCQPFRINTSPLDSDADGVTDGADNCPAVANAVQKDVDQDGIGDACDPLNPYFISIGGTLTGMVPGSSVVLHVENSIATDELQLDAAGAFTFTKMLVDGDFLPYSVSVLVQPTTPNQTCTISNGSGTPSGVGTDITDISVSCAPWSLVDTDGDGLTDAEEVNLYLTDPLLADTDMDGYDDGTEVLAGSDPLDGSSTPNPPQVPGLPAAGLLVLAGLLVVIGTRRVHNSAIP